MQGMRGAPLIHLPFRSSIAFPEINFLIQAIDILLADILKFWLPKQENSRYCLSLAKGQDIVLSVLKAALKRQAG
jgi:hypothetical protein